MGYVYLLLEVNALGDETHKIGISKNHPSKRVKSLQTGNSSQIRLLKYYETANFKKVEQIMHARYRMNKTLAQNEWFKLTDDNVLEFIQECQKADNTINSLKDNPFF